MARATKGEVLQICGAAALSLLVVSCDKGHADKAVGGVHFLEAASSKSVASAAAAESASLAAYKGCISGHQADSQTACEAFQNAWQADAQYEWMLKKGILSKENQPSIAASLTAYKACLTGHLADPQTACTIGPNVLKVAYGPVCPKPELET